MHEVARWMAGLSALVGFGLAMGLNPALYGATADMLARDVQTWRRLCWMVGGLFAGATVLFVLFQSFDPTNLVALLEQRVDEAALNAVVDLVAGILLLLGGIAVVVWRLRVPVRPTRPVKAPKPSAQPFSYFALGFSSAVVGFTTLPLMYLTGRVTSGLAHDLLGRLLAYGVFLVALGAPFFALAWLWSRFPTLSRRVGAFYTEALAKDYRIAFAVLLAVSGVALIVLALVPRT